MVTLERSTFTVKKKSSDSFLADWSDAKNEHIGTRNAILLYLVSNLDSVWVHYDRKSVRRGHGDRSDPQLLLMTGHF